MIEAIKTRLRVRRKKGGGGGALRAKEVEKGGE
jgi:hypothetical protein